MAVIDGRTWLEHLSMPECWRLLALSPVGRVGVLVDRAPEIYPVNHVVDDHNHTQTVAPEHTYTDAAWISLRRRHRGDDALARRAAAFERSPDT